MLGTHRGQKCDPGSLLDQDAGPDAPGAARPQVETEPRTSIRPESTDFVQIIPGQARVWREGDVRLQKDTGLPGTSWLVATGTDETLPQQEGPTECLIVFLPARRFADVEETGYDIDPAHARLAFAGGFAGPDSAQTDGKLRGLPGAEAGPCRHIFIELTGIALAAHLPGAYNLAQAPARSPELDARRLARVLNLIEARLGEPLRLDEMAAEACLSPFHFCRLFGKATGLSPHRYLVARRIERAQSMLREGTEALAGIALDVGFGSQASFTRSFHKATGMTPGAYRSLYRTPVSTRAARSVRSSAGTGKSDGHPAG